MMESIWIRYWGLEKQYGAMVAAAKLALDRSTSSSQLRMLHGSALALLGKNSEAISLLESLMNDPQHVLPAALALIYAHNSCEIVNKEAVTELEVRVKEEVRRASEATLNNAAWFHLLAGRSESAVDCADRMLLLSPKSCAGAILRGWIEYVAGKKSAAAEHFKQAASQEKQNTEAVLGEAMSLPMQEGMTRLNQLIVRFPKVVVPLIEKAKLQLANRDWTQTLDTHTRILSLDANNLYAVKIRTLHQICVEGNYEEGAVGVGRVSAILDQQEPASHELASEAVRLFTAVGGHSAAILTETQRLAERTLSLAPHLPSSLILMGRQHFAAARLAEASKYYRSATKVDDSSVEALTALTAVQLAQNGPTLQVQQQVEFLVEVGGGGSLRANHSVESELLLLRAACEEAGSEAANLLDHAYQLHKAAAARHPFGPAHLLSLNPEFLMRLAERYPQGVDGSKRSAAVLRRVVEACPGLSAAHLQLGKRLLITGDTEAASKTLQHLLSQLDPTNMDAHLILAQLHVGQGRFEQAESCLESVLSYNLEVRERPLYHLLMGSVHRHHGDHDSCITSLKTALEGHHLHPLSVQEMGTLYLELSSSLMAKGCLEEASEALQDAGKMLNETDQEGQVTIASAELALLKHDPTLALTLLASITPRHPCYVKARMKMADIHLYEMKDGRAYADCFRQLVESNPTTANLVMLGDAYVAIQEPEQAVETFEHAVKKCPKDTKLMCRLGDVLVRTHQYGKAIKMYREAGRDGCLQLAQLLIRLGQVDHAESVLKEVPLTDKALVLARVREKLGDVEGSLEVLQEAQEQLGRANPDLAAQICHKMAEYSTMQRNYDSAIAHYKRSLLYKPHDSSIQIALAKLYMQVNDWASCQAVCSSLLATEPNNEPALLMLADLAFRRVDFAGASVHFSQLLARRPAYWVALARLIEVKRRTAQLAEAKSCLDAAAAAAANQPGLSYCTGLFDWYNGNTNSALHHFNCARNDAEWGQQALHNMVEICLNGNEGGNTALRLLKEMKPHSADEEMNVRLLTDLVKLTSAEKSDVEQAMNDLSSLASHETLRVGATLGLATGYILQKQTPRARNILKRVAKTPWQFEEAEHLERCWIMLADLHVQAGKHDQATDLLRRVLAHNQACHRAHELLALISEKEQKYLDAGMQYQQAWKLGGQNDPALGFKLAFNMVKGKRYADAITTCQSVLKMNPDYPRIKKEVLEKAISHLRT